MSAPAPRGLVVRAAKGTDTISLSVAGKELTFNDATLPLFDCLSECAPLSIGDFFDRFKGEFQHEQLVDFLSDLVKHGVLVISEPR
jgi:hypothetical protein